MNILSGNNQSNSNMKIDTLSFIQCLLSGHHPTVFHPHAQVLVPAIIAAVSDTFYKISSEALVVLQLLVKVLRPLDSSPTTFDFTLYTNNIYQCCFVRLKVCLESLTTSYVSLTLFSAGPGY